MKSNGTLYWYGMSADPLLETDLSGNNGAEYVFFGGRRTARLVLSLFANSVASCLDEAPSPRSSISTILPGSMKLVFGIGKLKLMFSEPAASSGKAHPGPAAHQDGARIVRTTVLLLPAFDTTAGANSAATK
jgi:hypothetical protein